MRYVHIRSMAHNYAHSFMSFMNYMDDVLIADEIRRFTERTNAPVRIDMLAGAVEPENASDTIRRAALLYREHLPRHAASHGVELAALRRFVVVVERATTGMCVTVDVEDDRGVSWTLPVRQTAL
jgi:hypothetical protein